MADAWDERVGRGTLSSTPKATPASRSSSDADDAWSRRVNRSSSEGATTQADPGSNTANTSLFAPMFPHAGGVKPKLTAAQESDRKRAVTQVGRTISAAYTPTSPTGPFVGAMFRDLQENPGETMAFFSGVGGPPAHMQDAVKQFTDVVGKERTPRGVIRGIETSAKKYNLTGEENLKALEQGGGPIGGVAGAARKHPFATGIATGVAELANPLGWVTPGGVARAGAGMARGAARGVGSVAEATAHAAEGAGRAGAAAAGGIRAVKSAVGKIPGPFTVGDAVGNLAGSAFDRYHGVRASGGPTGENLAHAMESRMQDAARPAIDAAMQAFGDPRASSVRKGAFNPFKGVRGLTREEQMEVMNRAYEPPVDLPPHVPNPDLEAGVLKRTGISLNDRAGQLRTYMRDADQRAVEAGVIAPEDLYESGTFFPMKSYRDRPVFTEQFMTREPGAPEGEVSLQSVSMPRTIGPRAGFGVSRRMFSGTKRQPPNYLLPPDALDPQFLPAHQVLEHYSGVERAIAQAKALKLAEQTTLEKTDLPARVPISYYRDLFGQRMVLGEGVEGRNAAQNLVERERGYRAKVEAANAMGRPDLLKSRRSPLRSAVYLRGLGRGRSAGLGDLGTAERAFGIAERDLTTGAPARAAERLAGDVEKHGSAASMTSETLRDAIQKSGALQAALKSGSVEAKAAAREAYQALDDAQAVVRNQYKGTGNSEVDRYLAEAAQERGAKPAYIERRLALTDAAGNPVGSVRTSGNANRAKGFEESLFTPADVTAARKFAAENGVKLSVKEARDRLHDAHGFMQSRESILHQLIEQHGSGPNAVNELSRALRHAIGTFETAGGREAGARSLHDLYAGPATAAAGRLEDQQFRLSDVARRVREGQATSASAVRKAGGAVDKRTEQVRVELDQLANRLIDARADEKARVELERRANALLQEWARTHSISEEIDKKWAKAPSAGYVRERDLQLGARDSDAFTIEKKIGQLLAEPISDARGKNVHPQLAAFMRGMSTLNNLARTSIILLPQVHVLGNLGSQFLAKYRDPRAFREFAAALSGRLRPGEADVQLMRDSGALPGHMGNLQGRYEHGEAEVLTRHRSELPPLKAADQYVSAKYWTPNQRLVFGWFEENFAWAAFRREMERNGGDALSAGREVRKILGDYRNITGFERSAKLNRFTFFYPWLKTAVRLWTKQGLLNPGATIDAPVRAIQTANELQGYDDPNQPWTLTAGRTDTGEARRLNVPYAGRITEPLGRAMALPWDVAEGLWTDDASRTKNDAKSAFGIVANRLNPFARAVASGVALGTGANIPQFADSNIMDNETPQGRLVNAVNAGARQAIGPVGRIEDFGRDPYGAALSLLTGGFSYASPVNITTRQLHDVQKTIRQLRAAGRVPEAHDLSERLRQLQLSPPPVNP